MARLPGASAASTLTNWETAQWIFFAAYGTLVFILAGMIYVTMMCTCRKYSKDNDRVQENQRLIPGPSFRAELSDKSGQKPPDDTSGKPQLPLAFTFSPFLINTAS
ncbi:hypothetical protein AAVH_14314 [Aphelenchoides avenae]|nr:hypothetical protein AAVH_14314 [Aphelenchus avenae]